MRLIRCLAVIAMLAISLIPIVILADSSVDVIITATPMFTAGITSFTVTYITDIQMDLDWTVDGTVDLVMIRSSYVDYPADIPDEDTTPSDGNLVYYGDLLHFSDTSMDFDENLGTIYYKAWAQKADGHWYVATSTGSKESEVVTLILLFGFGLVISGYAINKHKTEIAIIASAIWLAVIAYTRSHPIGEMTTGDTADTAVLLALLGMMILVPIISFRLSKREQMKEDKEDGYRQASLPKKRPSLRDVSSTRTQRESADEYYDRLDSLTHPTKK